MNLDEDLDGLYSVPLGEFVARRNELAKRLRAGGEKKAAGRVKALPKPSLTAWVVNQLAFRAPEELAALMAAGARVRAAHLAAGPEQQSAARARRDAVGALLETAGEILSGAGQTLSRTHRQRISQSLEALSSRGPDSDEPVAGRLSRDLEPAGFDALADLAQALEKAQSDRAAKAAVQPAKATSKAPAKAAAVEPGKSKHERQAAAEARRRETLRRALDRQLEEADEELARLEEKMEGLRGAAESDDADLAAAKRAAVELSDAAIAAERLVREARRSAEGAAEKAQRARFAAESSAAALRRAESRRAKLRQKRESLTKERRNL